MAGPSRGLPLLLIRIPVLFRIPVLVRIPLVVQIPRRAIRFRRGPKLPRTMHPRRRRNRFRAAAPFPILLPTFTDGHTRPAGTSARRDDSSNNGGGRRPDVVFRASGGAADA